MAPRRLGLVLLSLWCVANALVALGVTALTLAGRAPPALALVMDAAEAARVEPRALGVVNAQAVLLNPLIAALCALVLVLARKGFTPATPWALPAVAAALLPVQAFGFVSDGFLGSRNLAANGASTAVLVAALGLLGLAARRAGPEAGPGP